MAISCLLRKLFFSSKDSDSTSYENNTHICRENWRKKKKERKNGRILINRYSTLKE
jgi:hypothetical protein